MLKRTFINILLIATVYLIKTHLYYIHINSRVDNIINVIELNENLFRNEQTRA